MEPNKVEMTPAEAIAACQKILLSISIPCAYTEQIATPIKAVVSLLNKVEAVLVPFEKQDDAQEKNTHVDSMQSESGS